MLSVGGETSTGVGGVTGLTGGTTTVAGEATLAENAKDRDP